MNSKPLNITLGVTASIAAYKACDIVKDLKKEGFEVTVVMTEDAKNFVTPLSMQTFSGRPVLGDFFGLLENMKPVHISLAKSSDLVLIAPATADIIAKIAHGFSDDLLSCTVLSTQAPVLIAPAMNDKMWENPITQENVTKLKKHGVTLIGPIKGPLACGDDAVGHLAEIETIIGAVRKALKLGKK
jgi:phosphopantothenoylcysteine synthetase/decarboxylase